MGDLCAASSHRTLPPAASRLYTRSVPSVVEDGSATRQGSEQMVSAQTPCQASASG